MKDRFGHRHRTLGVQNDVKGLAAEVAAALRGAGDAGVRAVVDRHHPADLASAMRYMSDEDDRELFRRLDAFERAELLDEVDDTTLGKLVRAVPSEELALILPCLPPDEGADVLGALPASEWEGVLGRMADPEPIRRLLAYAPDTAGG